jgi:hypothetical protein
MNSAKLNKREFTSTTVLFVSGIALIFLILNLFFFTQMYFTGDLKYQGSALEISGAKAPLPEITSGTQVSQTFFVNQDGISSVAIQVGTYMRKNDVRLVLRITDQAGKVLRSKTFSLLKHSDNSFLKFAFDPILNSKGKTMIISVKSPDSKPGNAVTLWTTGSDVYALGKLRVNDKYLPSDLVLSVKYIS